MNFRPALLVRVVCLLLAPGWTVPCVAQGGDGSLTGDFKKLSPKERSKIAARETHEAAADSGYQDIMKQADAAFRAGRYEDALAAFHEARSIWPYNVYPKVKIQDLQALIKKQDEERVGQTPVVPPPADPPGPAVVATPSPQETPEPPLNTPHPLVSPDPPLDTTAPSVAPLPSPVETETTPAPMEKKPVPAADMAPPNIPAAASVNQTRRASTPGPDIRPITIGERIYMEAGATVTERTVEDEGRPVVYKKVVHPWGQTYHFKDGLAISDREWNDRFNE